MWRTGFERTADWTFDDWKTCLETDTSKIRFECCFDECNQIQNVRSVQGHSGGQQIHQRLHTNVLFLYGWSDHIYHVGSTYDFGCICDRSLIAVGLGFREEPQTCFFTAVDPQVATMLTPRFEANAPRTILEKIEMGTGAQCSMLV